MRFRRSDLAPYAVVGALLVLVALALLVPATRALLADHVGGPIRMQADPAPGLRQGYSTASLALWALAGAVLAWAAYDLAFVRLRYAPDRDLFVALAPFLAFGPLFHAILAAGALPAGSLLAYLAAEPPVYLTTGVLALAALVAGRASRRPVLVPLVVGLALLAPLVVMAASRLDGSAWVKLLAVLALAVAPALVAAFALRARESPAAVGAVVGAHALDGATTWMVLRDPLSLGFVGFDEKNPVSARLVALSNGWPYYALKVALPLVILSLVKRDETSERQRAFLLFAVFVLGYGPGASNLLQVLLGS